MASNATTIPAAPRSSSTGSVRRLAGSLVRRPWARPSLTARLRGALPLRYPSDPGDAYVDPFTGIGSQPTFVDALGQRAKRARHGGEPFSLLLLDIDMLSGVNARFGPVAGDRMILRLSTVLRDLGRTGVRSFRIGGDEFAVLLSGASGDEALAFAQGALAAFEYGTDENESGTFSAGIAAAPVSSQDPAELYRQALAASTWVKRNGRGGVAVFEPETHGALVATETWQADMVDKVVSQQQLHPVFQPIVDLRSGRVLGFEGLVRTDAVRAFACLRTLVTASETTK